MHEKQSPGADVGSATGEKRNRQEGFAEISTASAAPQAATASPVYLIRLRSTRSGDDSIRDLRAALKVLLRRFGLRCTSIEEVR
jgi:hypothetical protein